MKALIVIIVVLVIAYLVREAYRYTKIVEAVKLAADSDAFIYDATASALVKELGFEKAADTVTKELFYKIGGLLPGPKVDKLYERLGIRDGKGSWDEITIQKKKNIEIVKHKYIETFKKLG